MFSKKNSWWQDRVFGMFFSILFIFLFFIYVRHIFLIISLTFLICAILYPNLLKPLEYLWNKFGKFLHHVTNPIVLMFIYYGLITPVALIAKFLKYNPLRLRIDSTESNWETVKTEEKNLEYFKRQY
jgi:hypothetical protein